MNTSTHKPDLTAAPWCVYAEEARDRWGIATPFRLGYLAAIAGEKRTCPYSGGRGRTSYLNGYVDGSTERAAQQAKAHKGSTP